jgi:hypothetical protein
MQEEELRLDNIDIRHFKLTNGDEVIGLIRGHDEVQVFIEFPLLLNIISLSPEKEQYYYTEWMPMAGDQLIKVYFGSIVAQSKCTDQFKEQYIRTALRLKETPTNVLNEMDEDFEDEVFDSIMSARKTIH